MAGRSHAARFLLEIGGSSAGFVKKASGLTIKGEVATHNIVGQWQKKNLATISHEDLSIETGIGQNSKALLDWMTSSLNAEHTRNDGALVVADFDLKAKSRRDFFGALITEVGFPALDGSSKDAAYMTVKCKPETIRYVPGDDAVIQASADVTTKKWLCSNFRVNIGELPCDRVSKVDAITWKQGVVKDEVGKFREPAIEPTKIEIPNLKLTISGADLDKWAEWHKSFVIDGKCTDGDELDGSIEWLGPDMDEVLGTMELFNIGIISLDYEAVEQNKDGIARFVVELYCERMACVFA
jgi:hypothetical protein